MNVILALPTAAALVAVKLANVAMPVDVLLDALSDGPPSVHEPEPVVTAAVIETLLPPVTVLPYWSCITTAGCVASTAPLYAGAAGCVLIASLLALPVPMVCTHDVAAKPVALTVIV